jgi:hypothetical protein
MKTLIVNFYGGPGAGKSKMAFRLTSDLKDRGYGVELAAEYAKDLTWQQSHHVLTNQIYVFGKQQHRIWRLDGKVQIIVTDSSILNSVIYCKEDTTPLFKDMVMEEYRKRHNLSINLLRGKHYDQNGRNQDLAGAIQLDNEITEMVEANFGFDLTIPGELEHSNEILEFVIKKYNELNK